MNSSARAGRAILDRPEGKGRRPAWRAVNITSVERLGRVAVGKSRRSPR